MWFSSWLANRNPSQAGTCGRAPGASRERPTFRPRLEALEGRCLPTILTVTTTADSGPGSLRYEISQANSGDTIVFNFGAIKNPKKAPQPPTITLAGGELEISKSLTIKGQGETLASAPGLTNLMDFERGSRIFEVDAGATVAISGLTLTGGGGTHDPFGGTGNPYDGYGGAVLNFGNLTISGCTLGGNTPVYYTPGDTAYDTGLRGNTAEFAGGAIANFGTMTVSACNVSNNSAFGDAFARGGGGGGGIDNAGTMMVSGSHVVDNSAGTGGGIENAGTMTVSGCYVQNNSAQTYIVGVVADGGGIYNAGTAAALTVSNSIFSGNSPDNISSPYTDGGGNRFS
jgi:hypothetical protein